MIEILKYTQYIYMLSSNSIISYISFQRKLDTHFGMEGAIFLYKEVEECKTNS